MYISNRETSGTPLKAKKKKGKLQLKLPTQTRSKQTVLTILDACSHLLIENGFFGVTTDRVAKAAGVSIGSLYQFFGNKESVVSALIQNLMKNDIEMLKSLAHEIEKTEPQNRVRFLVQSILEHFRPSIELRTNLQAIQNYLVDKSLHQEYILAYAKLFEGLIVNSNTSEKQRKSYVTANAFVGMIHNMLHDNPNFHNESDLVREITRLFESYLTTN